MSQHSKTDSPAYQRQLLASIFRVQLENSHNQSLIALNVYSNNFIENGIRALSISFPTVVGFIGEDSFRILAKKFLYEVPKQSFDWAEYGCELPDFIGQQDALNDYPFLREVAILDWAIHQAQRAEDRRFLGASFALLESGDTATLKFVGAPALQVLPFLFPIVELYQVIHDPFLQSEEGLVARKNLLSEIKDHISLVLASDAINKVTPRSIVLWRPEYKAQFEYISSAEAQVISAINASTSVNTVIETIDDHQLDLLEWLTKAISNKLIFAVA
ncbi:putative DNA-binding domain-containing protein [Glaciecola sp. MF2-115]|uniref:HvfC/BufC family peptide modification chaperone n=1 Tax=Glaciecola sp. MF2-115 TaxID=3384827 RepID=UPI0039A03E8A